MKKFFLLFILFESIVAWSNIPGMGFRYLKRSPKALLLGDAYTARATEDHTLFYNPASLGRHKGLSFYPINVAATATNLVDDADRFNDIPDDPVKLSELLLNYPVHLGVGGAPGLKFAKFGVAAILNVETNALLSNRHHPVLDLEYRYDNGFVTGMAFQIGKTNSGTVHLGLAAKYIKRRGLADRFSLMSTRILNAIDDTDDYKQVLDTLGYSVDNSWGGDIGLEYHKESGSSSFTWGISALNIGMQFKTLEQNTSIAEHSMLARTGLAYNVDTSFAGFTFSLDVHPLNVPVPFMQMFHLGFELDFPLINLYAGYNGVAPSYGIELDLFAFRIIAGFYSEEIGSQNFSVTSDRFLIYASLLDFSFDA
jgi:hypothetical protein